MILALARFRGGKFVRWVLTGTIWFSMFSTLYSLALFVVYDPLATGVSFVGSLALIAALVRWQRWYLIDAAALLLGAVSTAVLGISLSPPLVSVLLLGLAVYDAIAVYKTGHMLTLAESILNSGLPLMVVVPKSFDYREPKANQDSEGCTRRRVASATPSTWVSGTSSSRLSGRLDLRGYGCGGSSDSRLSDPRDSSWLRRPLRIRGERQATGGSPVPM